MTVTTLDPKSVLIVVDLQKGIVSLPAVHPMDDVVKHVGTLTEAFRKHELPVVLVNVAGGAPGRTEQPRGHREFPAGWTDLIPELNQQPQDHLVTKHTPGAFTNTGLEAHLRALGVTQVVIVGVATSNGVEVTARQAYELGFNVTFATEAMTDLHADAHTFTYTSPALPTEASVVDPLGETTVYTIGRDTVSRKPKLTQISGDCPVCGTGPNSTFTYADSNNPLLPTQVVDGRGLTTQHAYNANGQMTSKTEAVMTSLARTTTWQYANPSFPAFPTRIDVPSTSEGSALRTTLLDYTGTGDLETRTIQGAEGGSSFSFDTASTFNTAGQPLSVNPPGYGTDDQTTFTYDPARGDLIPLTRTEPLTPPLTGTTTFGHDGFNRRTSVTDANGVETVTAYDSLDRVTSVTQKGAIPAGDLVTTYTYNTFGDLFRTTLPRGNVIEYGYDVAGRLKTIERKPNASTPGERTFYTLDAFGHRTKEELQRWNGTAWVTESFSDFVYSSRCHLDKVLHPGGTATEYTYDCDGNLEQMWDANHPRASNPTPTQLYKYDELNRLERVTQPWAGGGTAVTEYEYDVQDHLHEVTDAEGNITTYTTGDRDLMTLQISPVSGTTTYTYNEHGELTSEIDARGVVTNRTIDPADRVTTVTYPDPVLNITYTYDDPGVSFSKGRLTRISRNTFITNYGYDRFGRVLQDGELTYGYDANGNPASLVYPGGVEAVTTFDFADRPATLLAHRAGFPDLNLVTSATYLPFGPLSTLTFGSGLTETHGFTSRYFPSSISLTGLLNWTYTTDAVGNILSITDTLNGANNRGYGYRDHQYFLTQGNGPWGARSWTYDKIGNRLTEVRGAVTDTYSYTPAPGGGHTPILSSIQLGAGGTRTYSYGPAGHLEETATGTDVTLFGTDAAGRLASLERSAGYADATFRYDGRDYLSFADPTELPFLDGFENGNTCAWGAAVGQPVPPTCMPPPPQPVQPTYSSEGLLHALTRNIAPQRSLVFYFAGRPVAQLDLTGTAESWKILTTDHLGTPIAASNTGGSVLFWQGGFEPFGGDWNNATAAGIFLRFPGQWREGGWENAGLGTGLYYNVHRWYETGTGRYTRPDPLGLRGSLHSYAYADLNPVRLIDPRGLKVELYCHPIGQDAAANIGHQAAGAAGYQHCFVRVKCNNRKKCPPYDRRLEVTGRNGGTGMAEIPEPPNFAAGHGATIVPFDPPDWNSGNCDMEDCVIRRYRELQQQGYPYGTPPNGWLSGPNSNTFADDLLRTCGVQRIYWPEGVKPFN